MCLPDRHRCVLALVGAAVVTAVACAQAYAQIGGSTPPITTDQADRPAKIPITPSPATAVPPGPPRHFILKS